MAEIEFVGYAGDCVVTGLLDVPPDLRLTDVLNATEELSIRNGTLIAHDDGHVVKVPDLVLDRHELFAVEGRGSRGAEGRRISTRTGRVELSLGPYFVRGTVFVRPGSDPLAVFNHPRVMVPMTDVTMIYEAGHTEVTHDLDALIVNRNLVAHISLVRDESTSPEMPRMAHSADPRAKDMSSDMLAPHMPQRPVQDR